MDCIVHASNDLECTDCFWFYVHVDPTPTPTAAGTPYSLSCQRIKKGRAEKSDVGRGWENERDEKR